MSKWINRKQTKINMPMCKFFNNNPKIYLNIILYLKANNEYILLSKD
jgi:hypothetical protein